MALLPSAAPAERLSIVATGQRYKQTERFNYLGDTISADTMDAERTSRIRVAWCALRKYSRQFYDRPVTVVPLDLKAKLLRSEALKAFLYSCGIWTLRKKDYDKLRTHHHRMLLRCIDFQKKKRTDHLLSYRLALEKSGRESIETTVHRRRLVLAASILRLGNHRLPSG